MLAWTEFEKLPGAADANFEHLVRGIVQRSYGPHGQLREHRNQPGVEFHIKLNRDCEFVDAKQHFGWQCKWYRLPGSNKLSGAQRAAITDALDKAAKHIPGLTDFVLCLPELPHKDDVDWYLDLDTPSKLHLWAEAELESRLVGGCEVLRATYFGEFVVSEADLADSHERAARPLRHRWIPDLHVLTDVELDLETALLRPGSIPEITEQATRLNALVKELRDAASTLTDEALEKRVARFAEQVESVASYHAALADAVDGGRALDAADLIRRGVTFEPPPREVRRLTRDLCSARSKAAIAAAAVPLEIRHAFQLLATVTELAQAPVLAVVGRAGRGKTQLAAELTAPSETNPAGVLIRGASLHAQGTLDDLADRVPALAASTFDELAEAVDAAGARLDAVVPVVIDGLNEAQKPTAWRDLLDEITPALNKFPSMKLVVTLRESLREDLPAEALQLDLAWQRDDVDELVDQYFEYYKIDAGDAWLPVGLFRDPLMLRMYCEATNGDRDTVVGVESLPTSLIGVFELYFKRTAEHLQRAPGRKEFAPGHVESHLARFATKLWQTGQRDLPFEDAYAITDDVGADWEESLFKRLEEEGLIFRDDRYGVENPRVAVLFDRLAGYLVATAVLSGLTPADIETDLSDAQLWAKLSGGEDQHPLGEDTLAALVGVLPRRFRRQQLWPLAPDDDRQLALVGTLDLEADLLDDQTVSELLPLVAAWPPPGHNRRHPFDRLWEVRRTKSHPLNARFLSQVLTRMRVDQRDLRWTEWVRFTSDDRKAELDLWTTHWENTDERTEEDELFALATMWLTTSTDLKLRDAATKALQRFGATNPRQLFTLAAPLLGVDDPYMAERLVAAALGAASPGQLPNPAGPFERSLAGWLQTLADAFLSPGAKHPSDHEFLRTYVRSTFEFGGCLHPKSLPGGVDAFDLHFSAGPSLEPISADDEGAEECNKTFGMDFENYVVGRLVKKRRNYAHQHVEYQQRLAEVRGRVWDLGWRSASFEDLDRTIGELQWRRHNRPDVTERYGKKYGWIGYYEAAGRAVERGELSDRRWHGFEGQRPDVDPTFCEEPKVRDLAVPTWLGDAASDGRQWLTEGEISLPDELWTPDTIEGDEGPWVLVEGYLKKSNEKRTAFGLLRSLLVGSGDLTDTLSIARDRSLVGADWLPRCPEAPVVFASQMPWHPSFEPTEFEGPAPGRFLLPRTDDDPSPIELELLAVDYSFGSVRSGAGLEGSFSVPSHPFASALDLRQLPGTLDLAGLDGRTVSRTLRAPDGWEGNLLYIRRSTLIEYRGADRRIVLVGWGEKHLIGEEADRAGLRGIYQALDNVWLEDRELE